MEERKRSLEQIANAIDGTSNTLRDSVSTLGRLSPERIEQAVNEAIRDLQGVARDLKYPVALIEVSYVPKDLRYMEATEVSAEEDV